MATAEAGLARRQAAALRVPGLRPLVRFCRAKPLGAFGLFVLVVFVIMAIFAPWLEPYSYTKTSVLHKLESASSTHWMGTDNLGRDVFSRIIRGARVELVVGLGAVIISTGIATVVGVVSGYFGGVLDLTLQRFIDIWMAFPGIVLLITLVAMFQPGEWQVTIAIGLLLAAGSSRIVRGATLEARSRQHIEAARSLGAADARIMLRHVLPNIFAPIMVIATTQLGLAILLEATLSFLGYGVPPPEPSWGSLLGPDARKDMLKAPMLSVWPGIAIFLAVYSFNVLGDALRDVLDPRLRGG